MNQRCPQHPTPLASINARLHHWEHLATVRNRPRRLLDAADFEAAHFFPADRLPLCAHPQVMALGPSGRRYIELQMLYQYLNSIAGSELVVSHGPTLALYQGAVGWPCTPALRAEALSILVDEAYHGLVALDLAQQVESLTGVEALRLPVDTEAAVAVGKAVANVPAELVPLAQLLCVALFKQARPCEPHPAPPQAGMFPTFYTLMHDHMADEARHARFFQQVLAQAWAHSDGAAQQVLLPALYTFMAFYTAPVVARTWAEQVLQALGVPTPVTEQVLGDTYDRPQALPGDHCLAQMHQALRRAGIPACGEAPLT